MLKRLKFSTKLLLVNICIIICLSLAIFWILTKFKNALYDAKYQKTKEAVETAWGVLNHYNQEAKDGVLTVDAAQQQSIAVIKNLRYGGEEYFWINDMEPKMILHPFYSVKDHPEWYKTNGLTDYTDPKGKKLFMEFTKLAKTQSSGFIDYFWTKPGKESEKPVPKISYIKVLNDWGWIIGSGVYLDDVNKEVQGIIIFTTSLLGLIILIGIGISYAVNRSMTQPLTETVELIQEISKGHLDKRIQVKREDELGVLARTMNQLADDLKVSVVGIMRRIADGDVSTEITPKDEADEISPALKETLDALRGLIAETENLTSAAIDGKLTVRGDAQRFKGGYRTIVEGVNHTLDAVIGPLNVAADYVDRISKGDIPPVITASYQGDFNNIKNNLNQCITTLNSLITEDGGLVLQAAANKDLTKRLEREYRGQFEVMKANINIVLDSLNEALVQVAAAVGQVSAGATQISSGSQMLAEGANQQASSLEEVSSSLEEMSSMTKMNAGNAAQAKTLTDSARQSAERGNQVMRQMLEAIEKIKSSSDETAKIIKTIDEIAFQTNMLALNAAVEAARAGEAGKGFAVVAEEVRNLAQRSAEAAKNTARMIDSAVKNSLEGVKITDEVAQILAEIFAGSSKVNGIVAEIAEASNEQSRGIEQVNIAVGQMNKVTQQNAANSEESASAAEEMTSQAQELAGMVAQFRLRQELAYQSSGVDRGGQTPGMRRPGGERRPQQKQKDGDGKYIHQPEANFNLKTKFPERKKSLGGPERTVLNPTKTTSPTFKTEDVIPWNDEELKDF